MDIGHFCPLAMLVVKSELSTKATHTNTKTYVKLRSQNTETTYLCNPY